MRPHLKHPCQDRTCKKVDSFHSAFRENRPSSPYSPPASHNDLLPRSSSLTASAKPFPPSDRHTPCSAKEEKRCGCVDLRPCPMDFSKFRATKPSVAPHSWHHGFSPPRTPYFWGASFEALGQAGLQPRSNTAAPLKHPVPVRRSPGRPTVPSGRLRVLGRWPLGLFEGLQSFIEAGNSARQSAAQSVPQTRASDICEKHLSRPNEPGCFWGAVPFWGGKQIKNPNPCGENSTSGVLTDVGGMGV